MDVNPTTVIGLADRSSTDEQRTALSARAELLQRHWPTIAFANLIITLVTVYLLWGEVDAWPLWIWLGCGLVLVAARAGYHLLLSRRQIRPSAVQQLRFYTYTAVAAGLLWALAVVLFLDAGNTNLFVFLLVVTLALSAGSLPIYAAYLPAHYGFSGILLTTIVFKLYLFGGEEWQWLSFLALIFLMSNMFIAHNLSSIIGSAITLDLKNRELLLQVTEAKEQAEFANRSKSRFLAAASHDLRQPLHAMGLFIDALRQRLSEPKDREVVGYLGNSQKSLENMFSTLLEVSKLDAGVVEVRREDFEIGTMAEDLAREILPEVEDKGIELSLDQCRGTVHSDRVLVERIMRNLLSNAVRYTDEGGVSLACRPVDGHLLLEITDTGVGIHPDEQERVFDEFHQVSNTPGDRREGMGLGLAIVRRMADLLGHQVTLRSEPGRGSTFSIALPVGRQRQVVEGSLARDEQPLAGNRVLVIDDEEDILTALTLVLEDWGCQSQSARTADEAVACAVRQQPDLILSDYQLSDNDADNGLVAIQRIRSTLQTEVPAIVISGITDPALLRKVRVAGLKLLYKPVDARQLRDTLLSLGLAKTAS